MVRYHEIALKGGNRQRFVQRLIANLRDATTGLGVRTAESLQGRVVLRLAIGNCRTNEDDVRLAWAVLRREATAG